MTDSPLRDSRMTAVAAGGVVLDHGRQQVLVIHRPAHGDWSLPKGHLDAGESLRNAALREVLEETGIRTFVEGEAGTTEHSFHRGGSEIHKVVHWFVMRPEAGQPDPAAREPDDEVDEVAWWPVGDACRDLSHPGERELLLRVIGPR